MSFRSQFVHKQTQYNYILAKPKERLCTMIVSYSLMLIIPVLLEAQLQHGKHPAVWIGFQKLGQIEMFW